MPTPNPNIKVKHIYPGDVARRGETRSDTRTGSTSWAKTITTTYPFSTPASDLGHQLLVIETTFASSTYRITTTVRLFTVDKALLRGRTWFSGDFVAHMIAYADEGQSVRSIAKEAHDDATSYENARKLIEAAATRHGYEIRGKE